MEYQLAWAMLVIHVFTGVAELKNGSAEVGVAPATLGQPRLTGVAGLIWIVHAGRQG
jgi:hypothetical protein